MECEPPSRSPISEGRENERWLGDEKFEIVCTVDQEPSEGMVARGVVLSAVFFD